MTSETDWPAAFSRFVFLPGADTIPFSIGMAMEFATTVLAGAWASRG
jgi:hypothetical protein